MDCLGDGCEGGDPEWALDYAYTDGISNATYKYVGKQQYCKKSKYPSAYFLENFCSMNLGGNENALKGLLANNGPLVSMISK